MHASAEISPFQKIRDFKIKLIVSPLVIEHFPDSFLFPMNFIMPMYFYFVEWQLRDLNRNIRTKILKTYEISDQYIEYIRNWCFKKKKKNRTKYEKCHI